MSKLLVKPLTHAHIEYLLNDIKILNRNHADVKRWHLGHKVSVISASVIGEDSYGYGWVGWSKIINSLPKFDENQITVSKFGGTHFKDYGDCFVGGGRHIIETWVKAKERIL